MNDSTKGRAPRERSPSFPFIPLKTAIARLGEFEKHFGRHDTPANRAYLAWGMKGHTSQAQQTLGALKAFGLVEYKGSGDTRAVSISDEGRTYLRAQQDEIKAQVLKRAALRPKWIAHFWPLWGVDRPPEPICLDDLVLKHKFNSNTAPTFLKVYDETIDYAKLGSSDKVVPADTSEDDDEDEDMEAAVQEQATRDEPAKVGSRKMVFPLDEGDVTLLFPATLTQNSVADLEGYLEVFVGKLRRDAGLPVKK